MDNQSIDEAAIRAYLLGRMGPEEEMSAQIDERMLADPEFSLLIDLIEDEILEEYVDGALAATDVEGVENHFLTPPERRGKLRRMYLISKHVAGAFAEKRAVPAGVQRRIGSPTRRRVVIVPGVRTWAEIAAGLVLAFCTIYFWNQQHELSLIVKESRRELELSKKTGTGSLAAAQEAAVTLNLVVPGLSRGDHGVPEVSLPKGAETLHVFVALSSPALGRLRIRLQQGDMVAWSRDGVEARSVEGGAVLSVDLPTSIVPEGLCRLMVSVPGGREISYWFKTNKPK